MWPRLLILLAILPFLELAVLIEIGRHIGALQTIALLLASGLVGSWLLKRAGIRAVTQVQADLAAGRMPGDSLLNALIAAAAGILFIIPGVISDAIALLLLIPPVRSLAKRMIKSRWRGNIVVVHPGEPAPSADWIDVHPTSARDVLPPQLE